MTQEARHVVTPAEKDPNVWGRFQYFAYVDPDSQEARALSGSLALYVIRPTLQEAVDELKLLMTDYIQVEARLDQSPEDIKRKVPSDAWETHANLFCEVLGERSGEQGIDWECGSIVVLKDGTIPTT